MAACARCTTHLLPGMSVCTGCGLPQESETVALPTPIPAAGSPAAAVMAATPNPWRQSADDAVVEPPAADVYVEAPAPVEAYLEAPAPVQAVAETAVEAVAEAAEAAPAKPKIAEGVPQDPPGMALKLSFADPLPPLPEPTFDTDTTSDMTGPLPASTPQFAIAEPAVEEPSFVLEDEPLAVPAAYATFAAEPIAADAVAEAPAEVVPLIPAEGLRVAPSTPYVADPVAEEARATAHG